MSADWDTTFKLPKADLGERLRRVELLAVHVDLRTRLTHDLLDHADNNVYINIGGLVMIINVAVGIYFSELHPAGQRAFSMMRRLLFRQLTDALLDEPEIRRVVLASLYDTNSIENEEG